MDRSAIDILLYSIPGAGFSFIATFSILVDMSMPSTRMAPRWTKSMQLRP